MKFLVALAWSLTLTCSLLAAPVSARNDASHAIRATVVTLQDGTQIHCLEAGELKAVPALVLIPGWTLPAFLWKEQLRQFSADRLVIAIDPRSQGDSSKSDANNTPEQRARDLREILSKRRVAQAVLVGWSQGAQDVAAYLQQFGSDGLAGVVFVDSAVSGGASELESNLEFSQGVLRRLDSFVERPAEYRAGLVRSLFKKPHPELQTELIAHVAKTPVSTAVTMLIMDLLTLDRRPALVRLDKPTLVIASADSDLLEAQKSMAAGIPGAQFLALPGTGHAVFVDDPATFNRALQGLLDAALGAQQSPSK